MNRNRPSGTRRTVLVIAALGGLAGTGLLASTAGAANARGGDDTSVEVRGRGGDPIGHAKNGADDPAGHVRGGKGADDPANHG